MAQPLVLILQPDQRETLELLRNTDPRPYIRERAAALLKIADPTQPQSGRHVALQGLLQPRQPDTVYAWVKRFQAAGVAGLQIKAGRGRKPAFSPGALHARPRPARTALARPLRPA